MIIPLFRRLVRPVAGGVRDEIWVEVRGAHEGKKKELSGRESISWRVSESLDRFGKSATGNLWHVGIQLFRGAAADQFYQPSTGGGDLCGIRSLVVIPTRWDWAARGDADGGQADFKEGTCKISAVTEMECL